MVAILMSVYNGQAYLQEQLDSILNQSFRDFELYIREDGSKDSVQEMISACNDPRIHYIAGQNLGPAGSFFDLLRRVPDADYIFFSDQDDVWHQDKLEVMLKEIRKYDEEPAMVFSDFSMIDSEGRETSPSYAQTASLQVQPGRTALAKVLAQPYAFGCASVINRKLADLAQNPPQGIEMHDCWLCQSAAAVGELIYLPKATISHRFHSSNATGRSGQNSFSARLRRISSGIKAQTENSALRLHQVSLLLQHYGGLIHPEEKKMLEEMKQSFSKGKWAAVRTLHRLGVARQKSLNTLFFYITVLKIKGEII